MFGKKDKKDKKEEAKPALPSNPPPVAEALSRSRKSTAVNKEDASYNDAAERLRREMEQEEQRKKDEEQKEREKKKQEDLARQQREAEKEKLRQERDRQEQLKQQQMAQQQQAQQEQQRLQQLAAQQQQAQDEEKRRKLAAAQDEDEDGQKEKKKKKAEAEQPKKTKESAPKQSIETLQRSKSTDAVAEESSENFEQEIAALEQQKPHSANLHQDLYSMNLTKDVYSSYDKLLNFARQLNTHLAVPEIVVVGKRGHGKTALIEAFFGEPIGAVGAGMTKRPVFYNFLNNMSYNAPKITVKRDTHNKEFDRDVEVKLSDISGELRKRSRSAGEDPIIVQYEANNVCNMTIIDTPGLLDEDDSGVTKDDRERVVLGLAKPSHRLILCVEASKDWSRMDTLNIVKKVDPEFTRTTFAFTKFQSLLQNFSSTREVNKFLSGALPDARSYFLTIPSENVRAQFFDPEKFKLKVWQSTNRDYFTLEQLQFDKRYSSSIGIFQLRQFLYSKIWRSYQDSVPRISKQLKLRRTELDKKHKDIEAQHDNLDPNKLRSIASSHVVAFLNIIEKLIAGTSEGNPSVNGQSLEEEKHSHGDGDWVDLYHRVIRFEPEEWDIPYWDTKLYGGQQFERLLAEYKSVAEHTQISEVTMDDVATAAGINKLNNIPNYAWAASDLAQQKSFDSFVPLIDQLTSRAVFIMKRLTDISEKIIESRNKSHQTGHTRVDDIANYPFFTYHIKDLYFKFIDHIAKQCREKCMDEFYSTRTIYWDLTENSDKPMPLERNSQEDTKAAVVTLATDLFNSIRDRVTKNVILKFYNFFLVPMQHELSTEIQSKMNGLKEEELTKIFESNTIKQKLNDEAKKIEDELKSVSENEKLFEEYANSFTAPLAAQLQN